MFAEIITIGDEILIGQIVDTNSAFIGKELNKIGVSVYQITSVQDDRAHILKALKAASKNARIVICTGGLGPTKDDITKHTFCEYFNDVLVQNTAVLQHVEALFAKFISTPISEVNRLQAMVPSKAIVLKNEFGTAPGLWIRENDTVYVSLPGVPFEMKGLISNHVIPKIIKEFKRPHILHKTIVTYGKGESAVAEIIEEWENDLPDFIRLAYLPSLGKVRLRMTAKGPDPKILANAVEIASKKLYKLIGDIIYGTEDEETLEVSVGKLFTTKKMTLATAESCTGGKIAEQITSVPGASAFFKGSVVSYATETKLDVLQVPRKLILEHSVVSSEVAMAMAKNVRELLKTDFAISTTGNAGPTKGESDAKVGTVYIGIASANGCYAQQFSMGNHRVRIVQKTVNKGLEMIQKEISKI